MSGTTSWWAQALHNRVVAIVLAMIVAVPLIAAPANVGLHGVAALAFEGFAIALLLTLVWRERWDIDRQKVGSFLRTGANLPALLFLGVALVSCALHPVASAVQEAMRIAAGVLVYFVMAYQFRRSEHLSKLVDALLFVGAAVSLIGFAQYSVDAGTRASGLFGNPQVLGSLVMILLPVVAVVAMTEKQTGRQLAAQVTSVLLAACLLLSQTRSAWMGATAGLAVPAVLFAVAALRNRGSSIAARKHQLVLPIMLLTAVGLFVALWPQTSIIGDRAGSLSNVAADASWNSRVTSWDAAITMLRANPLAGVGAGQYAYRQNQYTGFGTALANVREVPSFSEDAHSMWMKTAAELGFPGALALLAVVATFLVAGMRRFGSMDPGLRRNLLLGAIGSVTAFAVDGIHNPSWSVAQVSMFSWLMLGIGVGSLRPATRQRREVRVPVARPVFARPAAILASLCLASMLPTTILAIKPAYKVSVVSATINPPSAFIKTGASQAYTVTATFKLSDATQKAYVVTTDPGTTYQEDGFGKFTANVYSSVVKKQEMVKVTAKHTYAGKTVTTKATGLLVM